MIVYIMLSKKNRLDKISFQWVFKKGRRREFPYFNLIFFKNTDLTENKFGFVVSSKISKKAVVRNKLKRRAKSAAFKILNNLNEPSVLIFIFKKESLNLDFLALFKEIELSLKEVRLIK